MYYAFYLGMIFTLRASTDDEEYFVPFRKICARFLTLWFPQRTIIWFDKSQAEKEKKKKERKERHI